MKKQISPERDAHNKSILSPEVLLQISSYCFYLLTEWQLKELTERLSICDLIASTE